MEELVEIISEDGKFTGKQISKLEAHKNGICHGISAVALINYEGKLLVQKRAKTKKTEPNKWDLSSAGHIDINESAEDAAIRELYEEIGIKVKKSDLILIDTYINKISLDKNNFINHFTYLYIVKKDVDINKIIMQESEVSDIKYISKKEYYELLDKKEMVEGIKYCNKLLDFIK